jgi:N-hydroxyarylamine O-acetyltransferase
MTNGSRMTDPAPRAWVDRYLALLGEPTAAPSLPALSALIRAQFRAVTFENVTSLMRRAANPEGPVPPLDPDMLLANWEAGRGGGVCYEISAMFHRLICALGYDAELVLAQISIPDGHQALQVHLDGSRYLVDVGTGSPIFRPIPLIGTTEFEHAGLTYRFRADEPGHWVQERLIDGEWKQSCRYDLSPLDLERQYIAYQHHQTPGATWVLDKIRLIHCADDAVYSLTGNELTTITPDGKRTEEVSDLASCARLAAETFHLPTLPLQEATHANPDFFPIGLTVEN